MAKKTALPKPSDEQSPYELLTYKQRKEKLVNAILAELEALGHAAKLNVDQWEHEWFVRERDGAEVRVRLEKDRYPVGFMATRESGYVEVTVYGSRRQSFSPLGRRSTGTQYVIEKDVDPKKIAAKIAKEFDIAAEKDLAESSAKARQKAAEQLAKRINLRVGRNVVSADSWRNEGVARVALRSMNNEDVEKFVDAMHAAGLLEWLEVRKEH